ncbi:MAG: VWA domain-containing protein [Anaerolineaceae bacterium]|nr:VWA domain-containing protein [Anaerolineaceae bacterium]
MTFLWPAMLLFVLLVPLFLLLYTRYQRRRERSTLNFGGPAGMQTPGPAAAARRRILPVAFYLAGLTILIIALARPQAAINLPRVEGTVMLVFDVSGSMAAEDGEPTRMEAAKAIAREFVKRQPATIQIGVVSFSDSGFTVQLPTNDQDTVLAAIDRLEPQRGTSLAQGILASLKTIAIDAGQDLRAQTVLQTPAQYDQELLTDLPEGSFPASVIVLISDGENNEFPDPAAAAQAATDRDVRIYTVGVGSTAGTTLQVEGMTVFTRLEEANLQQLSQLSGGTYYSAEREEDLEAVYGDITPQLVIKPEKIEVTAVLTGASLLTMLAGGLFSLLWFNRLP